MNKRSILLTCLMLGSFSSWATIGEKSDTSLRFRVLLDGKPIGQHSFELRGDKDAREVVSHADFKVRFLLMEVYRYRHTATERWRGDCLEALNAHTDDNGDIETVDANRNGDRFAVTATRSNGTYQGCVRSFAYWNPKILAGGQLLNAQTGEYLNVRVLPMGEEQIVVYGRSEIAERYRLTGKDIDISLWYTPNKQWVALESKLEDGHHLRYERN